jgi:hypothetical protein
MRCVGAAQARPRRPFGHLVPSFSVLALPFRQLVPNHRDPVGLTDRDAIESEIARALAAEVSP